MSSTSAVVRPERRDVSWLAPGMGLVACVALVRVVLYLVAGPRYGYFRDELYYLACGEHPAWGYVDQPPLIGWVTWLVAHTIGTSLWAIRGVSALADVATILLAGRIARQLGGGRWAMFLAALAALMAPVSLALSHLYTMNAFDPLLWTVLAWLVIRITQGEDRLWVSFGLVAGITILNKYAILFWISGLLLGMLLTPLRESLRRRWFWMGCLLAAVIAVPNLLWEVRYHFPFLELMRNVRESGRDIVLGPVSSLGAQAQMLGFVAALLVPMALVYFFTRRGAPYRALGWAYMVFLAEMVLLHGKMYYVAPVYPMMFAAGAVWLEAVTAGRAWVWAKPALAVAIVAVAGAYLPTILPVLTVPQFLAYERATGLGQQKFEHMQESALPQLYADMFGWEEMTRTVANFYRTLPPEMQAKTAIFGNNYGDAGAIDHFGPEYGLPKAIGGHQSYWLWGPRGYTGESLIVMGEGHEENMKTKCTSYQVIGTTEHPLSRRDEWMPIYYCQGFKGGLEAAWPGLKKWR